jgi:hypothetical protein
MTQSQILSIFFATLLCIELIVLITFAIVLTKVEASVFAFVSAVVNGLIVVIIIISTMNGW